MVTDSTTNQGSGATPDKGCELRMIYLKDVSFEAPHSPGILFGHEQPELVFNIGTNYKLSVENHGTLGDVYDVLLTISIEASAGGRALFLIEVHQGGLVEVVGYTPDDTDYLLRTKAPELIYPYARELVTSLISRGGFPSVRLQTLNFERLYAEELAAHKATGAETQTTA